MKKRVLAILMAISLIMTLAACGGAAPAEEKPANEPVKAGEETPADTGWVGGYSCHSANIFFDAIGEGLKDGAEANGGTIIRQDSELELQRERAIIESFIEQKVDVIFLTPNDVQGSIESIRVANDANIPVIIISSEPTGGEYESLASIKSDDYSAARAVAEHAIETIGGEGDVLIVTGMETSDVLDRIRGYKDVIAEHEGKINLVNEAKITENSVAATTKAVEDMLLADPDTKAIFGFNGFVIPGAYAAMQNLGIDTNSICVVDVDGLPEEAELLASGEMELSAAMGQNSYGFGLQAVDVFLKWRESPDTWDYNQLIEVDTILLTPENADSYEVYAWAKK